MAQSLASLSPTGLKHLKTGGTITVWYRENENTESRILCESMPKNVAITFATKWKDEFPAVNKINTGDLKRSAGKKSVTIVGGNVVIHKHIINWMLSCCEGKGIRPFANPAFKAFAYLYLAHACAGIIGCDYLVNDITKRMDSLSKGQIHSEDVRMLYLMNPADVEMQKFLVDHVATRFWGKTLKAKGAYRTLREEIPGFNKAIDEILDAKKESRKKVMRAKRAPRVKGDGKAVNTRAKEGKNKMETKETSKAKGGEEKTVKLQAEVVRRGSNGRPAFAKLDLASIGISKEQFSGRK
ncbi:hypothetical protein LTR10_021870 [Elasticomyces elasticus]|uniref:Uncharacterized protein n=1 Tax=Exophiala sideris TaxID=1016849 RepID=A0ABR0JQL9_9EURO|nr:hypothetical protein LTR10_021870 [Elasticomyces elasticus]KAK5039819.1 hypothetical protein LTS07_000314 [Exophiala sideris]KAK5041371.1 hypothetical protein LTR13_002846 [Exophiala sideris]KAK5068198.1 hypothetical protein LTR69_000316 [Exophiala sideris]KAK5187499.1 hypothetical protein LTR44_000315 [Eurotiomycetes sp. CCFEE 6388]